MASALVKAAGPANVVRPQRAASVMRRRDSASVRRVSLVADAINAFKDIGIMDQMDAHVK